MSNANLPPSANVEIYTWRFCPECMRAKGLLDRKKITYSEYAINNDHEAQGVMANWAQGRHSLPQIFINKKSIGGFDDLCELDRSGMLDQLLGLNA